MIEQFTIWGRTAHRLLSTGPWPGVWWLFAMAAGAALGSYVAATAFRLRSDHEPFGPFSRCESCHRRLRAWENVPVLGFLLLRGRCRTCGATIRPLDFFLELFFALAMPLIFLRLGPGLITVRALVALPLLVIGSVVDLHEQRLPLGITGSLLFVALLLADPETWGIPQLLGASGVTWVVLDGSGSGNRWWRWLARGMALATLAASPLFIRHVLAALLAAGAFALLDRIYCRIRHVDVAIGGGDIRLVAGIAALTGARGIVPAIFVAAFLGSLIGLGMVAVGRGSMRSQLPFGPFLAFGCMAVLLCGPELGGILAFR